MFRKMFISAIYREMTAFALIFSIRNYRRALLLSNAARPVLNKNTLPHSSLLSHPKLSSITDIASNCFDIKESSSSQTHYFQTSFGHGLGNHLRNSTDVFRGLTFCEDVPSPA